MNKEKLLNKLRKLNALANDPTGNVNEAAAAAAQMTELMHKHGLESSDFLRQSSASWDFLRGNGKRPVQKWQLVLLTCIAKDAGVVVVGFHGRSIGIPVVIGEEGQVAACMYCYHYITREIDRLQKQLLGERKWSRHYTSFCTGAVDTITGRMAVARQQRRARYEATNNTRALVWVDTPVPDEQVQSVIGELFGDSVQFSSNATNASMPSRHDYAAHLGRQAGYSVKIDNENDRALQGEKEALPHGS